MSIHLTFLTKEFAGKCCSLEQARTAETAVAASQVTASASSQSSIIVVQGSIVQFKVSLNSIVVLLHILGTGK